MLHKLKSAKNAWALYLVHVAYGFTLTQVGTMFRRDRTTVAHACIIIEDRRDDLAFDVLLDDLETAVVCLTSALNSFKI
jgi:chromosomal replication initiation ATPase DnaA